MLATGAGTGDGTGLTTGLTGAAIGLVDTTGLLADLPTPDEAKPSGRVTGGNDAALEGIGLTRGAAFAGAAVTTAARGAGVTTAADGLTAATARGVGLTVGCLAVGGLPLGLICCGG